MFLAILNDSYYEVKNVDAGEAFADAELGAFMVDYMKDKYDKFKDDTFELIEGTIRGVISFFRGERKEPEEEAPLQSSEPVSENVKLASLDSMDDIGSDDDENGRDTDPVLKTASLDDISDYMCESVSLSDLKETILQIGREMRQSLTSITSAVSSKSLSAKPAQHDLKKAIHWLDEDDNAFGGWRTIEFNELNGELNGESLNVNHRTSSYFFSLGSYLEDIWQKEEERKKRTKKSRPKDRRQRRYKRRHRSPRKEICETSYLLEPVKRETVVNFK